MTCSTAGCSNTTLDDYNLCAECALERKRQMLRELSRIAEEYNLPLFAVTEGASITRNNGSEAVKAARDAHATWEREHGENPDESWD